MIHRTACAVLLSAVITVLPAWSEVTIEMVTVGHPGNTADLQNDDAIPGIGSVDTVFDMGRYPVTNAQYVEFLNAVAATDTNALYSPAMGTMVRGGIVRSGSSGYYSYELKPHMGNKPVNLVSYLEAMRFANWMHNDQPTGAQDASTTESGAYDIANGLSETRNPGAHFFIPTENEWYKAAYHQPQSEGGDVDDYWSYATATNDLPSIATATATGDIANPGVNVVNYATGADWNGQDGNLTTVGSAGPGSDSHYGTSDQAGNAWEWNETLTSPGSRGLRGGSWSHNEIHLHSSDRFGCDPGNEFPNVVFRLASTASGPQVCETATPCGDVDGNGIRDDACKWWECNNGTCNGMDMVVGADMGGPMGTCYLDGFVNVHDRYHALNCFARVLPCDDINIDAGGPFGSCVPDGHCNIHDANTAILSFAGLLTCACPTGPAPEFPPAIVGAATLQLAAERREVRPGDEFDVRVFVEGPADVHSYQLDIQSSGGKAGRLELVRIEIEDRRDDVFSDRGDVFDAVNVSTGQMLSGLADLGGAPIDARRYLATYTYHVSKHARGTFVIDAQYHNDNETVLVAPENGKIEVSESIPTVVTVSRRATRR
jgi:formylglycine-generating enzyme required for sulfatase activity